MRALLSYAKIKGFSASPSVWCLVVRHGGKAAMRRLKAAVTPLYGRLNTAKWPLYFKGQACEAEDTDRCNGIAIAH